MIKSFSSFADGCRGNSMRGHTKAIRIVAADADSEWRQHYEIQLPWLQTIGQRFQLKWKTRNEATVNYCHSIEEQFMLKTWCSWTWCLVITSIYHCFSCDLWFSINELCSLVLRLMCSSATVTATQSHAGWAFTSRNALLHSRSDWEVLSLFAGI